ncbi:MAG: uracil-DNA glycosylase [Bacteroidetes bacterium]|nr:uracil-DNA glycosylase [Bacteroidota bacterium]
MTVSLAQLGEQIRQCICCDLSKSRTHAVPGEGSEHPDIMFVGEGPGYHEDQQGRPFVGPAGAFLQQLLESIGLKRSDVYITNVVKCRPPNNRDPLPAEIMACTGYLDQQIRLLKPKMVVTLGRHSLGHFFPNDVISRVHGTARKKNSFVIFAMYHPAAALHQHSLRQVVEADMRKIPAALAAANETPPEPPQSQQLSMF